MKKIVFLTITSFLLVFCINPSFAQEKEEATTSSDQENGQSDIRKRVTEKIEQAQNRPKAFIGTVTDISEDTLQIKNKEEEIQLISLNENDTTFAQINDTTKTASFNDLAIGDFTVSMGYVNDSNVLDSKRILITSPIKEPVRKIVFGTVKQIVKKEITIVSNDGEEIVVNFPKKWKGPEINELEEGTQVAVVYLHEDNTLTIRTIEITNHKSSPVSENEG